MSDDINEQAQRQAARLPQSNPADHALAQSRVYAERREEQARYDAERTEDRMADARREALRLAAGVCGERGDPAAVLDAARDFSAFLTGSEKKAH